MARKPLNEDLSRLPKWARQRIETAESNAAYWQDRAHAAATTDPQQTNVVISNGPMQDERGLPPDSRVVFRLGPSKFGGPRQNEIQVHVDAEDPKRLVICGVGPVCSIKVLPRAANLIYVVSEDH